MTRSLVLALLSIAVLASSGCSGCSERPSGTRRDGGIDAPLGMDDVGEGVDGGPPNPENCANSLDDTGEGYVDEGCSCPGEGEWQYCWPGTPGRRGVGACRDGIQQCISYGAEFLSWGNCEGAILPTTEIPGNGIDEDCDGSEPGGSTCGEFEDCTMAGDEDCDGYPDCTDIDCAALPSCVTACTPSETVCADRIDDDCDGYLDCDDPECAADPRCVPPPPPPPGCTREFPFLSEIACGDGRDNDCDGSIDCADIDCQRCTPGTSRWCDDPMYCHWGLQACGSDGRWGTCVETTERPTGCSGSIYSRSCCVDAGECCENYPTDRSSVGECASIVECR